MSEKMTVKEMIQHLQCFPLSATARAYEGEVSGLIIESPDRVVNAQGGEGFDELGVIHTGGSRAGDVDMATGRLFAYYDRIATNTVGDA